VGHRLAGEACMKLNDPNHFAASNVKNSPASVADQLAFDALPDETKAMITRLYTAPPAGGNAYYTEEDLEEAYAAGWEDCAEDMEPPYFNDWKWKSWLKHKQEKR
jgi:hypothetical protein